MELQKKWTLVYLNSVADLKSAIGQNVFFKNFGKAAMFPNVILKTRNSITSNDKPKL